MTNPSAFYFDNITTYGKVSRLKRLITILESYDHDSDLVREFDFNLTNRCAINMFMRSLMTSCPSASSTAATILKASAFSPASINSELRNAVNELENDSVDYDDISISRNVDTQQFLACMFGEDVSHFIFFEMDFAYGVSNVEVSRSMGGVCGLKDTIKIVEVIIEALRSGKSTRDAIENEIYLRLTRQDSNFAEDDREDDREDVEVATDNSDLYASLNVARAALATAKREFDLQSMNVRHLEERIAFMNS